jgi:hypothetical protein
MASLCIRMPWTLVENPKPLMRLLLSTSERRTHGAPPSIDEHKNRAKSAKAGNALKIMIFI